MPTLHRECYDIFCKKTVKKIIKYMKHETIKCQPYINNLSYNNNSIDEKIKSSKTAATGCS